ncbi:MAG: hypothetical protein JO326_14540 [Acetobacteraceae bacterium]|nr:hypothetical protein [Acetobacteraceae bacterium]
MRPHVLWIAAALMLGPMLLPASGQRAAAQSSPPHAWLFGAWTGGLFPVPSNVPASACLGSPTVIFTRDVVLRAMLTQTTFQQRVVETARTDASGTTFRFAAAAPAQPQANALFGGIVAAPAPTGFGCANPDELRVVRRTENEITFPDCAEFPNPLVRCSGR